MFNLPDTNPLPTALSLKSQMRDLIRRWKVQPVQFDAHTDIQHEGDRPGCMYFVSSGWLYSYGVLSGGQRQILFLHNAGDLAGFVDLGATRVACSIRSMRNAVLYPIPLSAFSSASFLTPEVSRYLLYKSAQMQSLLMRTLMAVGRMDARQRIVWLLLMLEERAGEAHPDGRMIDMPLNQTEIGDLVGLTNVSVSKHLCQLSEEGYIDRRGIRIVLRKMPEMVRMVGYETTDPVADLRLQPV